LFAAILISEIKVLESQVCIVVDKFIQKMASPAPVFVISESGLLSILAQARFEYNHINMIYHTSTGTTSRQKKGLP
jgi:hypothetical protein